MTAFAFSKLVPGGNPTILLHDPGLRPGASGEGGGELAALSARIMSPLHLHAEQVGALYSAEADEWSSSVPDWDVPRLEMMGGEFCVNAVRSSALCLARQGWLQPRDFPGADSPIWGGWMAVSGAKLPICVMAAKDPASLARAIAVLAEDPIPPEPRVLGARPLTDAPLLHCAAEVPCPSPAAACAPRQKGACLVTLPGISHVLVDTERHPLPDLSGETWKRESEAWRTLSGVTGLPASGVVWYRREGDGYAIWPAVAVRATGSEHLESACGSASLALALLHAGAGHGMPGPVDIRQPSGDTLTVWLTPPRDNARPGRPHANAAAGVDPVSGGAPSREGCSAWVSGPVMLVAEGKLYA